MNVRELIAELRKRDPNAMVVRRGYEGGVETATSASEVLVAVNSNTTDMWSGKHTLCYESGECELHSVEHVKGVYVS